MMFKINETKVIEGSPPIWSLWDSNRRLSWEKGPDTRGVRDHGSCWCMSDPSHLEIQDEGQKEA